MEMKGQDGKLPGFLRPRASALPLEMFEVESGFVVGARLERGRPAQMRKSAFAELEVGTVVPSPVQLNVANPESLTQKLRDVARSVHARGGSCALLVPDGAARVSILSFDTVPARKKEMDELIRWRIKESLGFPAEEARLTCQATSCGTALDLMVLALKEDVLAQYESVLDSMGMSAGLILPSTFALLPWLPEDGEGGQLLTHLAAGWVTHAVVTGKRLRFWRTKALESANSEEEVAGVVSEAARARASVEDRMGIQIDRAWYCARPAAAASLAQELERAIGCPPARISPAHRGAIPADHQADFEQYGAPFAGLAMNGGGAN